MRGDPIIRAVSTPPFHWSGPITGDQRSEGTAAHLEQRELPDNGGQERCSTLSPSAQTLEELLADELADLLWRRPELGRDQVPSSTTQRSSALNSGTGWDQLLAEIEDLARELKTKVAQYALLRATKPPDVATGPANGAAGVWIHETLEDIAATALGMDLASKEVFLRAGLTGEQELGVETAQEERHA